MNTTVVSSHPQLRGLVSTRFVKALAAGKGKIMDAIAYESSQNHRDTPEVLLSLKAAVGGLDTDNAAALLGAVGVDFSEFLRPLTIIGRITGFRRVPFGVRMLSQDTGTAAGWVAQGHPAPVSAAEFSGEVLGLAKVAAIAVLTSELVTSSAPSAEATISRDLARAAVQALDSSFIDPNSAAISGVRPASVTSGAPAYVSQGSSLANIDADLEILVNSLADAGSDLQFATWIMRPRTAVYLSRLRGTGGAPAFPGVTAKGGLLLGLPVVTSAAMPITSGSGDPSHITLLDPTQISLADDGAAEFMATDQATVQMSDSPTTGAEDAVSLWQQNLVGIRLVKSCNWKARQAGAAAVLSDVSF